MAAAFIDRITYLQYQLAIYVYGWDKNLNHYLAIAAKNENE